MAHQLPYERTDGRTPGIIFARDDCRHGNFHPLAYREILKTASWARRLEKAHTAWKRVRVRSHWQWKELDCASSSDALLMNIFCYPEVMNCVNVRAMLGVELHARREFGFKPRTPLRDERLDNTEIDMRVGDLLVEAKLTEADFQTARPGLISRYRDLDTVFDQSALPLRNEKHTGYQLIRGTLAAHAIGCSFCVFCDARRPDLVESWYEVMRAVRLCELRWRLKLLTWQELAAVLPNDLRQFLADKYGIVPTG